MKPPSNNAGIAVKCRQNPRQVRQNPHPPRREAVPSVDSRPTVGCQVIGISPLGNLLNAVGAALKPKVFCVGELADQGAGRPDFGLYAARQVQKGRPPATMPGARRRPRRPTLPTRLSPLRGSNSQEQVAVLSYRNTSRSLLPNEPAGSGKRTIQTIRVSGLLRTSPSTKGRSIALRALGHFSCPAPGEG